MIPGNITSSLPHIGTSVKQVYRVTYRIISEGGGGGEIS